MKTAAVILLLLATPAAAQQQTVYGPDGKAVSRLSRDSQGTVTVYDAASGRKTGSISAPPRRH